MSYCGERCIVKLGGEARIAASLKCKSWGCEDCAPERKRRLIAECHAGSPNTFLTLTSRRRDDITAEEAAKNLTHAWRLIRKRLMRRNKMKKLPFCAVMEATKNGWPHLHILLRSVWLDRATISAWMDELTNSPIVDIRRIDQKSKVSAYVAKYAGKCAHKFQTAKRYFKSRDYDLRSDDELAKFKKGGGGWINSTISLRATAYAWSQAGWDITWLSKHRIEARQLC